MGQCLAVPAEREAKALAKVHQGRAVARHFRAIKRLGVGSYGSVYLVERLSDGKRYALKETLLTELVQPLRWVAVNEVRILASLDPHPHVVSCMEGFLDGDYLCIVMEYMPGGELADIIQRYGEKDMLLPEADVWSYFIQAALGLKYLHVHCILHRDLKPQNILMCEEGKLKIADLGVAHVVHGPKGSTKVQIGTPHYMAPEVWRREPYSFPADIWALGCILHELCSLKPLFLADSEQAIESRVIAGVVPPISRRYSQELRDLIARMLQYHPDDRPTIDEVLSCQAVRARMLPMMGASQEQSFASMMGLELDMECAASSVLDPIEVPTDLKLLNSRLPRARYSSGPGLITILAEECRDYREFTLGPAELPEFQMPRASQDGELPAGGSPRRGGRGKAPAGRKGAAASGGKAAGLPVLAAVAAAAAALPPSGELASTKGSCALSVADTAWDSAALPPSALSSVELASPFAPLATCEQPAAASAGGRPQQGQQGQDSSGGDAKRPSMPPPSPRAAALDSAAL